MSYNGFEAALYMKRRREEFQADLIEAYEIDAMPEEERDALLEGFEEIARDDAWPQDLDQLRQERGRA